MQIHEDAKSSFDNKGNDLLTKVEEAPPEQPRSTFSSDVHIKHHFTDKDMISIHPGTLVDGFGEEHGFFFFHEGKKYGIFDDKYKELLKLAESITRIPTIRQRISQKTIKDLIYEWINKKSNRLITDELTEYILREASNKVAFQEVWLPIRFLQIEVPFTVGRVMTTRRAGGLRKAPKRG
ncbi:hypothetical protein FY034_11310 [Trichlorobacter lovleyi]|uniref:hypothetical protein n=1 Tax=Trichlorobacter lovleyi TaxID=313985 RepID=UPI00223EFCD8|nr:hypothetical protein [Trichlorobacter lovleyi]QOX79500.1 hypothetical protein FY034_11310 [Trichlorobacter lovleyi]